MQFDYVFGFLIVIDTYADNNNNSNSNHDGQWEH